MHHGEQLLLSNTECIQFTHPFLGKIISDRKHEIKVHMNSTLENYLIKSKTMAMNPKLQKSRLLFLEEREKSIWCEISCKPTAVGQCLSVTELNSKDTAIFKQYFLSLKECRGYLSWPLHKYQDQVPHPWAPCFISKTQILHLKSYSFYAFWQKGSCFNPSKGMNACISEYFTLKGH